MIPAEVHLAELADQLAAQGYATTAATLPDSWQPELAKLHEQNPKFGFVFLEHTPAQPADMIDIGHDLSTTQTPCIIVRSPNSGAVYCPEFSRAQIESAQELLFSQADFPAGAKDFLAGVSHEPNWNSVFAITLGIIIVCLVIAGAAQRAASKMIGKPAGSRHAIQS